MPRVLFPKRKILIFAVLAVMLLFLTSADIYMQSVSKGIKLYCNNVLPAMLPFVFFSKVLTELDFATDLAKFTKKPLSVFYGAPPEAGYILLMSLLCGYPIGARLLAEFYENGALSEKEARTVSSFTSTAGPVFILGTVGNALFHNVKYGVLILLSHYIGTFLNGFIYRNKDKNNASAIIKGRVGGNLLQKSAEGTFYSLGVVGIYIVLFTLVADMALQLKITPAFSDLLASIGIPSRLSFGFLTGLIEMTNGCRLLSTSNLSPFLILPCCTYLISFGGLGVTFQNLSYLSKIKISPAFYLLGKCTQGILSGFICLLFLLIV